MEQKPPLPPRRQGFSVYGSSPESGRQRGLAVDMLGAIKYLPGVAFPSWHCYLCEAVYPGRPCTLVQWA